MEQYSSIEAVIRRAIQLEIEAETLYTNAASTVKDEAVCQRLQELAAQERGHKAKLEDVLAGNVRWAIRRSTVERSLGRWLTRSQSRLPGRTAFRRPSREDSVRVL
jgi:hypothetical protein